MTQWPQWHGVTDRKGWGSLDKFFERPTVSSDQTLPRYKPERGAGRNYAVRVPKGATTAEIYSHGGTW